MGGMSDQETGAREWRALTHMVEESFARSGDLEPIIDRHLRRARLELEEQPSFANYRLWTVWGPADPTEITVPMRRLTWRKDLDGDRGQPMERLRRLGSDLAPTIDIADSRIPLQDLAGWVDAMPTVSLTALQITTPRAISLDGNRCSLSLDARGLAWKHEWLAVGDDWAPADPTYQALASWALDFRDRLQRVLD
jgi:hypothetical protein